MPRRYLVSIFQNLTIKLFDSDGWAALLSSEALTAAVSEINSTARMIDWCYFLHINSETAAVALAVPGFHTN